MLVQSTLVLKLHESEYLRNYSVLQGRNIVLSQELGIGQ